MNNQGKSLSFDPSTNFQSTDADHVHKSIERIRHYGKKGDEKLYSFSEKKDIEFWI